MKYIKETILLAVVLVLAGAFVFQGADDKMSPKGLVTQEGQIGDILVTTSVAPKMSPKITKKSELSPSPTIPNENVTKNSNQTQSPSFTPAATTSTPRPTQTARPSVTPTPSPTASPSQSPTPTPAPSPTATPSGLVVVVINEIGWMGTGASTADEWIELYNPGSDTVDLTGWSLKSLTGPGYDPKINLSGSIGGGGYFLLERTNDDTLPQILADQIYTGGLNNSPGEALELRDSAGNMIDLVGSGEDWYAGSNSPKASMERIDHLRPGDEPSNWGTSTAGYTPKARNSVSP